MNYESFKFVLLKLYKTLLKMNEKIKNYREERIRLNEQLLSKEHDADILKRVYAMDTYTYHSRQKGLTPKYKEILGLITSPW